jgi:hypothetical protein
LFQAATSLSFRFPFGMPFAGFSGIIFGESPVSILLEKLILSLYGTKKRMRN